MNLACVDTNILIYGLRGLENVSKDPRAQKAKLFFETVDDKKLGILITTPVLSEYLVKVNLDDHKNTLNTFQKLFRVVPFDSAAAMLAAQISDKEKGYYQGNIGSFGRREKRTDS